VTSEADDISPEDAERAGMIRQVVPHEQLLERTVRSPQGWHFPLTKQVLLRGLNSTPWEAVLLEFWGGRTRAQRR